ncbi:MAG: zinc-dependent alcohol dehydrogenase family protein [Oligoflexus sp.]
MKAMVLQQHASIFESPLHLHELEIPEPQKNQIRVRVKACAICRTDLHVIEGELAPVTLPLIPGHQIVGTLDKCGPDCQRFHDSQKGSRIGIAWLRYTCGTCMFCHMGQENLCESSQFTGYHKNGGFAEYAIIDENFSYKIPDGIDDVAATPLLCAGIIGYRSLKRANLPLNGKLGIYGFGSSASIVIQIALNRNAQVFVSTREAKHQNLAKDIGAAWVGDNSRFPEKLDSAIIFAPAGELVPVALRNLRKGGTLALAGIYMSDIPSLNYEECLFYEKNLHSVTANTRKDGEELFREAVRIPIKTRTNTYSLKDANRALQDLKNDRIAGSGVLIID